MVLSFFWFLFFGNFNCRWVGIIIDAHQDVSEGKNNPIYNAHSYHTKVPHKAIMKYIKHYTNEGDIVFDGFCGTGMTGVAAQILNRKAILSDLSPIATFIAYNYNRKINVEEFAKEAKRILVEVEDECGWIYETKHIENNNNDIREQLQIDGKQLKFGTGTINYTVWSDVFNCPYCGAEIVFWEANVNKNQNSQKEFACHSCKANMNKNDCQKVTVNFFDKAIGREMVQTKQKPVMINYTYKKKRYKKRPDAEDLALIEKVENSEIPYWFPANPMMNVGDRWGDTWRKGVHFGITNVHHFYTKRNLWLIANLFNKSKITKFTLTSFLDRHIVIRNRFLGTGPTRPLSGTLYIPSVKVEVNVINILKRKFNDILKSYNCFSAKTNNVIISTNSLTMSNIKDNSVDYIFIDPPFGENIMYSELNYVLESWLKVTTNNKLEAIINKTQGKDINSYGDLMRSSLLECYRILKPNRWITIEFHNTSNKIWNLIQTNVNKAGFVISNVSILDKKHGGIQSVGANYANKDLIISAYKPRQNFSQKLLKFAGEGLEEEFIKMHLSHLKAETTIERTEQMLYSKLIAYYVQRSYSIKYDASTFYKMLRSNFVEEDGYWFNKDQVKNYREYKQKMKLEEIDDLKSGQMMMFIDCEKTAIIWLNTFLVDPKTFQEVSPQYQKVSNIAGDNVPDLKELLDKNFILENGKYRRPQTEDEKMSVTQKRERELQREFDVLLLEAKGSKKKIKECRKQAVIYGFEQCYKNNRFQDILALGKRLNKKIIENDSEISEFIEVAELKVEGF